MEAVEDGEPRNVKLSGEQFDLGLLLIGCSHPLPLRVGVEQMLRESHSVPARRSLQHLLRLRQSALVSVLIIMVTILRKGIDT